MRLVSGYGSPAGGKIQVGFRLSSGVETIYELVAGAVILDAAHNHYPQPFAPAGFISGAVLMDLNHGRF